MVETLYHGSKSGIGGDIAPKSRAACDFGSGFYMAETNVQPVALVASYFEKGAKLYTLEADFSHLNVKVLSDKFDWAMTVAYYRGQLETVAGTFFYDYYAHLLDGYDLVKGLIANDKMFTVLPQFFNGTLSDAALYACLDCMALGVQVVAKTKAACKKIHIVKTRPISLEESVKLIEARQQEYTVLERRVHDIRLQYRRTGRFFDEILSGVIKNE